MDILLTCPKCQEPQQLDASMVGRRGECAKCGQWFIVGQVSADLPVVSPHALVGEAGAADTTRAVDHRNHSPGRGKFVSGNLPANAAWQRRRCAVCGSPMSMSHGESKVLDFFVPVGSTLCWECERCGKEVNVQSPKRLLLMLFATPLLVAWWMVFSESSVHHDPSAAWWKRAAEAIAPHDSKGSFWFILFLLIFALAPLTLIREMFIRMRYRRIF